MIFTTAPVNLSQKGISPSAPNDAIAGIYQVTQLQNLARVQTFIKQQFLKSHQAQVNVFAPNLLTLINTQGVIQAALGYRTAVNQRLFLEHYLDAPIEQALSTLLEQPVLRQQVVELGNLASSTSGSTRRLVLSLCQHFYTLGTVWLTMTMTVPVQNTFAKLGISDLLLAVADARPDNLPDSGHQWGTYYQSQPRVFAINLPEAIAQLQSSPLLSRLMSQSEQVRLDHKLCFCEAMV